MGLATVRRSWCERQSYLSLAVTYESFLRKFFEFKMNFGGTRDARSARGPSLLSPAFIAREGLEEEEVVELRNALLLRDKQIGHEAWAAAALGGGRA